MRAIDIYYAGGRDRRRGLCRQGRGPISRPPSSPPPTTMRFTSCRSSPPSGPAACRTSTIPTIYHDPQVSSPIGPASGAIGDAPGGPSRPARWCRFVDGAVKVVGRKFGLAAFAASSRAVTRTITVHPGQEAEASAERFLEPSRPHRTVTRRRRPRRLQAPATSCSAGRVGPMGRHLYLRQLQDAKASGHRGDDDRRLATWGQLRGPGPRHARPASRRRSPRISATTTPSTTRSRRAARRPDREGPCRAARRDQERTGRGRDERLTRRPTRRGP